MTHPIVAALRQEAVAAGLPEPLQIESGQPGFLDVNVEPMSLDEWAQWCELFAVELGSESTQAAEFSYAKGTYRGQRVVLFGLGVPALRAAERAGWASGGDSYPCQIGVYCDNCGTTAARDYLVNDAMNQAARFAVARRHLAENEGWNCDPATGRDLCPACAATAQPTT